MEVGFFETMARDLSGKGQLGLILQPVAALAALVVGALLVWLPFVFTRAVTNRIWRRVHGRRIRTPRTA